ncbi:hypothetical protein PsorP6_011365 [Peronosclerospora sorghi]|uniref:Uncharacterized protein n=1 Tax=Peronosclerospora sorghi TaxID=230839 RepID=A0ACC0WK14_9STRA|nr:hypothetical protein PsorP6_011365 [Peronosclerospora sorghi]
MTFSATLALGPFPRHHPHSLDRPMSSPRAFAAREEDEPADTADLKLTCSISSGPEVQWPSFKVDERDVAARGAGGSHGYTTMLQSPEEACGGSGFQPHHGLGTIPGSHATSLSGPLPQSVWNMISSTAFEDTCLAGAEATTCGFSVVAPLYPSINTLHEPLHKLALEHDSLPLPVTSMPYPGTSWFMSSKMETGASAPLVSSFGTPRSQALGAPALETGTAASATPFRAPCLYAGSGEFPSTSGKAQGDVLSSYACEDVTSPVEMDHFAMCLPHPLEPSELLFEDMSAWPSGATDTYDAPQYPPQPYATPVPLPPTPSMAFPCFEGTSSTIVPPSHPAYTLPPYQRHALLPTGPAPPYRPSKYSDVCSAPETRTLEPVPRPCPAYATLPGDIKSVGGSVDGPTHRASAPESPRTAEPVESLPSSPPRTLATNNVPFHAAASVLEAGDAVTRGTKGRTAAPLAGPPTHAAKIQLLTDLSDCYWKNGRKNLQCFPSCPEHHDFYSMKMNNRKHSSVGVCRGPVYCHAFTSAAEFFPAATTLSTKRDGALRGGGTRELYVLGRFERVPQQESTNLVEALHPPPSFPTLAVFEQFRFTCFQAVEMEERRVVLPDTSSSSSTTDASSSHRVIRSTWFFLPDVWKVQPMLKKKRKATRSAPAQTFPFCFRLFIYTQDRHGPGYSCIADTASTFFELYSTRTVDRVKRKYWSTGVPSRSMHQRLSKERSVYSNASG